MAGPLAKQAMGRQIPVGHLPGIVVATLPSLHLPAFLGYIRPSAIIQDVAAGINASGFTRVGTAANWYPHHRSPCLLLPASCLICRQEPDSQPKVWDSRPPSHPDPSETFPTDWFRAAQRVPISS